MSKLTSSTNDFEGNVQISRCLTSVRFGEVTALPTKASSPKPRAVYLVEDHARLWAIVTEFVNSTPSFEVLARAGTTGS